jgi:2-isopropylmalate synthase
MVPTATVRLTTGDTTQQESGSGDGPVDAAYRAIDQITKVSAVLKEYSIRAITPGKDALGEVTVGVEVEGQRFIGRGSATDVIEASVRAYLNAINKAVSHRGRRPKATTEGV